MRELSKKRMKMNKKTISTANPRSPSIGVSLPEASDTS
jgi:hypothetical protein